MAHRRPRRPDLDEPISLHPLDGEDVLERLLQKPADEDADSAGDDEDAEPKPS